VVVDDAEQGVDQVVRGDDLLPSTPRQAYLAALLHIPVPEYAHVQLVVNSVGARLAKRDGAVTLADLALAGASVMEVRDYILQSVGLPSGSLEQALAAFVPGKLPREPWVWTGMGSAGSAAG
jgi:glutamyl-tRNA synthetase